MCHFNEVEVIKNMKQILFLAIILLLVACGGGGHSKTASENPDVNWKEKELCAIVFVGIGNDFASISETETFKELCEQFPSLKEATKFTAETEGNEIFYIIPRYANSIVTMNEYKFDIEKMKEIVGRELYHGGGEPILIKCNISDIHQNSLVTVVANNETVKFNPYVGGDRARGDMWTISLQDKSEENQPTANSVTDFEYVGVRATITNGKVTIRFDHDKFDGMLLNQDALDALENKIYHVENEGVCKSVFIGDVGQEINPVLACILEDGGVETLEIYDALVNRNFKTSGRLPGYEHVVSVINAGLTDEIDGETISWGGALFAVDAEGNKVQIETELGDYLCGGWKHIANVENTEMWYLLDFTDNWEISYKSGPPNSETFEFFIGRIWKIKEEINGFNVSVTYGYEMTEADNSAMTGIQPDKTVRKGSFRIETIYNAFDGNNYIDLTCIDGLRFYPNEPGTKIRYERIGY